MYTNMYIEVCSIRECTTRRMHTACRYTGSLQVYIYTYTVYMVYTHTQCTWYLHIHSVNGIYTYTGSMVYTHTQYPWYLHIHSIHTYTVYIHSVYTYTVYMVTTHTQYPCRSPAPMNHLKIFQGWPPRDAPSKLVQLWYKSFPPDQRGLVEMENPTRMSNKTSNASSCAEDQILENKISGT